MGLVLGLVILESLVFIFIMFRTPLKLRLSDALDR